MVGWLLWLEGRRKGMAWRREDGRKGGRGCAQATRRGREKGSKADGGNMGWACAGKRDPRKGNISAISTAPIVIMMARSFHARDGSAALHLSSGTHRTFPSWSSRSVQTVVRAVSTQRCFHFYVTFHALGHSIPINNTAYSTVKYVQYSSYARVRSTVHAYCILAIPPMTMPWTYIHTYIHTCIHTYIHIYMHMKSSA